MGFPNPEKYTFEDLAKRWGKSVDYIQDLVRQKKLQAVRSVSIARTPGSKFPDVKLRYYIPQAEKDKFEKAYHLRSTPEQPALPKSKDLSDELRLAVAAYVALYCGNNPLDLRGGHKAAIKKYLKGDPIGVTLSDSAIERIVMVVNPNRTGGAPTQE